MTELEEFHLTLCYAKIKFQGIKAGYQKPPWDIETQRNIDALCGLCNSTDEIEAHIIAANSYFGGNIDYPKILLAIKECCKSQASQHGFTFAFFNRLNLLK